MSGGGSEPLESEAEGFSEAPHAGEETEKSKTAERQSGEKSAASSSLLSLGSRSLEEEGRRKEASPPSTEKKTGGSWFNFLFAKWRGTHKHRNAIQLAQAFGAANQPGKPGPVIGIVVCKGPRNELQGLAVATPRVVERYLLDGRLQQRVAVPEPLTCFVGGKIGGVGRVLLCGTQAGRVFVLKAETFEQLLELDSRAAYATAGVSLDLPCLPPRGGLTFCRDPLGRGGDGGSTRKGNAFWIESSKRERKHEEQSPAGRLDTAASLLVGRALDGDSSSAAPGRARRVEHRRASAGSSERSESTENDDGESERQREQSEEPIEFPACLAISALAIKATFAEFVHYVIAGNVRGHVFVWQVPSTKLVHLLTFPVDRADAAFLRSQESLSSTSSLSHGAEEALATLHSSRRASLSLPDHPEVRLGSPRLMHRSAGDRARVPTEAAVPGGSAGPGRQASSRDSFEAQASDSPKEATAFSPSFETGSIDRSNLRGDAEPSHAGARLGGSGAQEAGDFLLTPGGPLRLGGDGDWNRRRESAGSVSEVVQAVGSVAEIDLSDRDTEGDDAEPVGAFAEHGPSRVRARKAKKGSNATVSETPEASFFTDTRLAGNGPTEGSAGSESVSSATSENKKSKSLSRRKLNAKRLFSLAGVKDSRRDSRSSDQASVHTLGEGVHTPGGDASDRRASADVTAVPAVRVFQSEEQHSAKPRRGRGTARVSLSSMSDSPVESPSRQEEQRFQSALEEASSYLPAFHDDGELFISSPDTPGRAVESGRAAGDGERRKREEASRRGHGWCEGPTGGGSVQSGGSDAAASACPGTERRESATTEDDEWRGERRNAELNRGEATTGEVRGRESLPGGLQSSDDEMEDVSLASDCASPPQPSDFDSPVQEGKSAALSEADNHDIAAFSPGTEERNVSGSEDSRRTRPQAPKEANEEAEQGAQFSASTVVKTEGKNVFAREAGEKTEPEIGKEKEAKEKGEQEMQGEVPAPQSLPTQSARQEEDDVPLPEEQLNGDLEGPRSEERQERGVFLEDEPDSMMMEETETQRSRNDNTQTESTFGDKALTLTTGGDPESEELSKGDETSSPYRERTEFPTASAVPRFDAKRGDNESPPPRSPHSLSPSRRSQKSLNASILPESEEDGDLYLRERMGMMTAEGVDEAVFSDEASELQARGLTHRSSFQQLACTRQRASEAGIEQRYVGALLTVAAFDQLWIGYGDGTVAVFALSDYCLLECAKLETPNISRMELSKFAEVVLILSGNELVTVWSVRTLRCLRQVPTAMLTCGIPLAYLYVLEAPEAWDSKVTIVLAGCVDGSISVRRLEKSAEGDDLHFLLIRNYVREVEPQVPISAICIDSWLNAAFVGDASGVVFTLPYVFQLLDPSLVPAVVPPREEAFCGSEGHGPSHPAPDSLSRSLSSEDIS
ncbi:hypothetical protein TGPRC2_240980 [Toxoplasma gondii TgCatPRC2]|uniref:Uncharacterized protein n=1 Tax=Toxoplasma gondii TgCatPRC2 TaxID=1130821 RepID=A0A151H9K9_TOXGO|nr:hypothetical protein TGPRC2_240980 [Toxoplasma gondii TgCatPRC2]